MRRGSRGPFWTLAPSREKGDFPDRLEASYYISTDGAALGPFPAEEIPAKVDSGELLATTFIYAGNEWIPSPAR